MTPTSRINVDQNRALGPGKVRVLELVGETGSISAAGRAMEQATRDTLAQRLTELERALAA